MSVRKKKREEKEKLKKKTQNVGDNLRRWVQKKDNEEGGKKMNP